MDTYKSNVRAPPIDSEECIMYPEIYLQIFIINKKCERLQLELTGICR